MEYEGNVQICYNNLWGGICDSGWSSSDAQVVCRQLGYLVYGKLSIYPIAYTTLLVI